MSLFDQTSGQSLGFRDQANFTRMFRRIGGMSARQFRHSGLH